MLALAEYITFNKVEIWSDFMIALIPWNSIVVQILMTSIVIGSFYGTIQNIKNRT